MNVHGQPRKPETPVCAPGELTLVIRSIQSYEEGWV